MFNLARTYKMLSGHKYCNGNCLVSIKCGNLISISKCRAPKASADKDIEDFSASLSAHVKKKPAGIRYALKPTLNEDQSEQNNVILILKKMYYLPFRLFSHSHVYYFNLSSC